MKLTTTSCGQNGELLIVKTGDKQLPLCYKGIIRCGILPELIMKYMSRVTHNIVSDHGLDDRGSISDRRFYL
jgi:hypothetical protein